MYGVGNYSTIYSKSMRPSATSAAATRIFMEEPSIQLLPVSGSSMLTPSMTDDAQMPMDAHYSFGSTSGVFMKWDALLGTYVSVGATAESVGETVVWCAQTPAENAKNPVLTITVTNGREPLGEAALTLTVDGEGYRVDDYALN